MTYWSFSLKLFTTTIISSRRMKGRIWPIFSGRTLGQKSTIYPKNHKIHFLKIWLFTKFTFSKSHFSQNSHFKVCTEQGHWWRHPDTNMTWSNYTQCVNIQDLQFRNTVNIISLSGWTISLVFMLVSLFIFFYFRWESLPILPSTKLRILLAVLYTVVELPCTKICSYPCRATMYFGYFGTYACYSSKRCWPPTPSGVEHCMWPKPISWSPRK